MNSYIKYRYIYCLTENYYEDLRVREVTAYLIYYKYLFGASINVDSLYDWISQRWEVLEHSKNKHNYWNILLVSFNPFIERLMNVYQLLEKRDFKRRRKDYIKILI